MDMINKNIFRPLSRKINNYNNLNNGNKYKEMSDLGVEAEEDELNPSWVHKKGVYEIYHKMLENELFDLKIMKKFISLNYLQEV